MLDLSPEKIMALIAIGLVVLGPQRLPDAARILAQGLARARHLAATLTQPLQESLAEPRRSVEAALADVREVVYTPARTLSATVHPASQPGGGGQAGEPGRGPVGTAGDAVAAGHSVRDDFDPTNN